jgi:hypothetical protein
MSSLLLRLPRAALARRDVVTRLARNDIERSLFAFKCDELTFARALLARRTNYWLYRTSQRAFAGDFAVVDLSVPRRKERRVLALELKRGEPLRVAACRSVQLANAPSVVRALADEGVVDPDASVHALVGDAAAVLTHLARAR